MANNKAKLTSGNVNLKGTLSNAVIQAGGTTDYNELENKPDLSVYALTQVTYEKDHESSTYQYRQDEYAMLIGSIDTKAEDAKAIANHVNDMIVEKADKEHTHEEYAIAAIARIIDRDDDGNPIYYTEKYSQEEFAKYLGDQQDFLLIVAEQGLSNYESIDEIKYDLLPNKADKEHSHSYNDLTELPDFATKKELDNKADYIHQHSYNDIHDIQNNFVTREEFENSGNNKEMIYPDFVPRIILYPEDVNTTRYIKVTGDITIEMPYETEELGDIPELSELVIYLAMDDEPRVVTFEGGIMWQQDILELEAVTWYEFIFTYVNGMWCGGYIAYKDLSL